MSVTQGLREQMSLWNIWCQDDSVRAVNLHNCPLRKSIHDEKRSSSIPSCEL